MSEHRFNEEVWFNWQQPAVPMLLDLTFEACGDPFRTAFGFPFFTSVLYYRTEGRDSDANYVASWLLRYDEGVAVGRWLVDLLLLPSFAAEFERRWEDACAELLACARSMRAGANGADEVASIGEFRELFLRYYSLGAITEPLQWFCEGEIRRFFSGDAGVTLASDLGLKADTAAAALYTMSEEPYAFTVERELLDLAAQLTAGDPIDAALEEHARRFYWKANNYARVHETTAGEVREEVEALARRDPAARKRDLMARRTENQERRAAVLRAAPHRIRRFGMLVDEFGSGLADRRKAVMNESLAGLAAAVSRLANEWRVPLPDLMMLGPAELGAGGHVAGELQRIAAARRETYVQTLAPSPLDDPEMEAALSVDERPPEVLAPRQGAIGSADGESGLDLLAELDAHMELFVTTGERDHLRGQVVAVAGLDASSVRGIVRIVLDPVSQRREFIDGEILVASSTTPDYVPLMRRAAAIVTNMGGMLQHAAHFAREEDKPCVVGTGYATSSLTTGDEVVLDLVTGEISHVDQGSR